MRLAILAVLLMTTAQAAVAQSCATLTGMADCGSGPGRSANANKPKATAEHGFQTHGSIETTISNRGASTSVDDTVVDSHGIVEFNFNASRSNCRTGKYGSCY
jgi:hypothetical protein